MFFGPEEQYTWMSSSLLSAMVRRLLLDRIEATIYSWTVSGDPTNAGMHVAAFPHLDVTKVSIRQPCLNFTVYSSHMLPCWLNVLLLTIRPNNHKTKLLNRALPKPTFGTRRDLGWGRGGGGDYM